MVETFLVKHAVGAKTFIDTGKQPIDYQVEQVGEGWVFTVNTPLTSVALDILKWKDELNVFIFQQFEDKPTVKTWYYVKDGPVTYDEEKQQLTIAAGSRIEYVPDEF